MTRDKELIHHVRKTTNHRTMNEAVRIGGAYLYIYIPKEVREESDQSKRFTTIAAHPPFLDPKES